MAAEIHSIIADHLAKLQIQDQDGFAGRAADAIAKLDQLGFSEVRLALSSIRTDIFRRNNVHPKNQVLDLISKRVVKEMSNRGVISGVERTACSVLFLSACPQEAGSLSIDEERRAIEQKIRGADDAGKLHFHDRWAVRPDDLLQCVNELTPQIVHFSGHGDRSGIVLATDKKPHGALVEGSTLAAVFEQFPVAPSLVVMNSCYSAAQASGILRVAECVVGMSSSIQDSSAIDFAGSFYRAIASGRSVEDAFKQAKLSLDLEGSQDSTVPVLVERNRGCASKLVLLK